MLINKNEFFTYLAKHGVNNSFAKAMLDGTVPQEVKYQFDSTYEWDTELPIVREMLALFVYLGIVPQALSDEILNPVEVLDIRPKRYSLASVGGEVVQWIEENIQPKGSEYKIESSQMFEDGKPVFMKSGAPLLQETGIVETTGILPLPEVK